MKIDESCINHNVVRLIDDLTGTAYDIVYDKDANREVSMAMTLGNIVGIIEMAKAMKEVLNT